MTSLTKTEVLTGGAPALKSFLSQGVVIGNTVYVSGSLGMDPTTNKLVEGSIGVRTTRSLQNISSILEAAGSSLDKLVKINIFITDMKDYNEMNEAYIKIFDHGVRPVRTCVAVKQLPLGTDVEIEGVAHL